MKIHYSLKQSHIEKLFKREPIELPNTSNMDVIILTYDDYTSLDLKTE